MMTAIKREYRVLIILENEERGIILKKIIENLGGEIILLRGAHELSWALMEYLPHFLVIEEKAYPNSFDEYKDILEALETVSFVLSEDEVLQGCSKYDFPVEIFPESLNALIITNLMKKYLKEMTSVFHDLTKNPVLSETLVIDGEVKKFNEFNIVLNAPIKIRGKVDVLIYNNKYFTEIFDDVKFVNSNMCFFVGDGRYDNFIRVIGASESTSKKIRSIRVSKK